MDQGDHGDHGAGWWTRSTVVPLLHFADVEEGKRKFGSKIKIWVGEAGFPGVKGAQGISRWVVQVEIAQHQRGKRQITKKVRRGKHAKRSLSRGEIVGVGNPQPGEGKIKKPARGKQINRH